MTELEALRAEKDELFAHDPGSPLSPAQKRTFHGLRYFPEYPALRLQVRLEPPQTNAPLEMQTSTGEVQVYERLGRFRFDVDGKRQELTIYQGEHGLFLPFVDSLAGKETYPAGRYIEPEELPDGSYLVDFNQAYNPYCAYNEMWSCPITPPENRLTVPVRAGEKLFDQEGDRGA